jgi:hypothetical protein
MNKDIKIIDNFLSKTEFTDLKNNMLGNRFPWFYNPSVVGLKDENPDNFQFVHNAYYLNKPNSDFYQKCLEPLFIKKLRDLKLGALIRIKANLTVKTGKVIEVLPYHCDFGDGDPESPFHKSLTAIYYVNTNNGYTKFEDGTKIESVENRFVIFPTFLKHTSATTSDQKIRAVIVFNYF